VLGDDWFLGQAQAVAAALGRGSGGSRSTSEAAGPGGVGVRSGRVSDLHDVACLKAGARVNVHTKCECGGSALYIKL
jgi:hypothetical protein